MKDVSAKEFIEAFGKHLKKGNKIKMPDVLFIFLIFNTSGQALSRLVASKSSLLMTRTGFIPEQLLLLINSTSEERSVCQHSSHTMVANKEMELAHLTSIKVPEKLSDTV